MNSPRNGKGPELPQMIQWTEFSEIAARIRLFLQLLFRVRPLNSSLDRYRLILWSALPISKPARVMEFQFGHLKFATENHNGLGMISVRPFEPAAWNLINSLHGSVFIDVGANVGGYSISAASRFKVVIAVEPSETARRILLRNAALNGVRNLQVVPKAVSSTPGPVRLYHSPRLVNYSLINLGETYSMVDTVPLDDLLAQHESVDLLKVDVEGAEMDVVESGLDFINCVSRVVVEVRSRYESRMNRMMSEHGFVPHVLEDRQRIGEKNILFVKSGG